MGYYDLNRFDMKRETRANCIINKGGLLSRNMKYYLYLSISSFEREKIVATLNNIKEKALYTY